MNKLKYFYESYYNLVVGGSVLRPDIHRVVGFWALPIFWATEASYLATLLTTCLTMAACYHKSLCVLFSVNDLMF